jgi:hypothetical protein
LPAEIARIASEIALIERVALGGSSRAKRCSGTVEEPSYSTQLLKLASGKWVEERTYNHLARRVAYKVSAREAALWLIKHGYGDVADAELPSEVEATRL